MENPAATPASSNVIRAGHAPLTREDIRNPHTALPMASPRGYFTWLDMRGLATLGAIRAHHVSTYIETLTHSYSGPSQAAPRRDPPVVRLADRRPADPNERELISDPRDPVMRSRFASRTSMSLASPTTPATMSQVITP
jgi:hypothetical protein